MGYKNGGLVNLTAIKIPDNNQSGILIAVKFTRNSTKTRQRI
jgi:hypothetical protein